jgi:epoxyqueuosine reductase
VKSRARDIGFSGVGVAQAVPLYRENAFLREWLSRGYHGTMGWMSEQPEKRTDPTLIVPGAKSVVMVALNYYSPASHVHDPGVGKISRYAWGDDYHVILSERLELLWQWMLKEFPGTQGKWYVDTGPVMEKAWAQRGGIGWLGKHGNIITREFGSWVFLGEIITTLELEPDQPAVDHCGTCTLCIEACPTDAIVEPSVVDSNRCLSYLTIEHRGEIRGEVTEQFDGWIYGCDVCQDVCPWNNKFAVPTDEPGFAPREGNVAPELRHWREMPQAEFTARFKGSPVKRTKREGLIRNVKIVLGEQ